MRPRDGKTILQCETAKLNDPSFLDLPGCPFPHQRRRFRRVVAIPDNDRYHLAAASPLAARSLRTGLSVIICALRAGSQPDRTGLETTSGTACTTAPSHHSTRPSNRLKRDSNSGSRKTLPCVIFAQLLKTLRITHKSDQSDSLFYLLKRQVRASSFLIN